MIIREATVSDSKAIGRLVRLAFAKQFENEAEIVTEVRIKKMLQSVINSGSQSLFVAESDEKGIISGYVSVIWVFNFHQRRPDGLINEIVIDPTSKGKGIGSSLMETVKKAGLEQGCSGLTVQSSKMGDAYKKGFFSKLGWIEREHIGQFILPLE